MSNLIEFKAMLASSNTDFEEIKKSPEGWLDDDGDGVFEDYDPADDAVVVIRVNPGSRCHFEAEFNAAGCLFGQWAG